MRETQRKGDIAVSQAVASFTKLGYDVMLPLTESLSYDLIVDTGTSLKKVQVKYSSSKDVDLRRIHSNSKGYVVKKSRPNSYDWLYILRNNGDEFLIRKCLYGRRAVSPQEKDKIK